MPRTASPSQGQVACQGGQGHRWYAVPAPQGYRSVWYITVHWRCETCGCMKRTHMDAQGRIHQGSRVYPADWVKHALSGDGRAKQRLAFIRTLDDHLVARKNGRSR